MRTISLHLCVLAASVMLAAPAHALRDTWVTASGSDTGSCHSSTPCATVPYAITQTDDGGQIHLVSPLSVESTFIDSPKTFSLIGDGQVAISPFTVPIGIGIGVDANDEVTLRGFILDQRGFNDIGINFVQGQALHVEDCVIRNGATRFAVEFRPTGTSELYMSNCVISDSRGAVASGGGILIQPTGSGSARVFLDNVRVENNRVGILVDRSQTTGSVTVVLRNSTVTGNQLSGILSRGNGTIVRVANSTISGNGAGLFRDGGTIVSHGGNVVADNNTNGTFSSTVPQQ